MKVFYSDGYEVPLPSNHRFPMEKYRRLREWLLERRIVSSSELFEAPLISREALLGTHSQAYVEAVFDGRLGEAEVRRLGFPWSEALVRRSRASVGGTVEASRCALEDGFGANLAGGTHHAHAGHGEGYCVFNDIAVATRLLLQQFPQMKVAIVDLDVHQGNGTAALFEGEERVLTFSMHGEHNFPFRKSRSTLDVGLPDGVGDDEYLQHLDRHLTEVLDAFRPQMVFYQAGVDPLAEDTLGRLCLTLEGLRERDRRVFWACRSRGIALTLTLGGGYARPIEKTLEAHVGTYLEAREVFS